MKKTIPTLLGTGTGRLVGAVKSTTSVGTKVKGFFSRINYDFRSGYRSTKNVSIEDLPY